jgi:sugar O-acyltransferase (sialic acid O-acetyltransferase NeuD family)
VAKIVVFGTGQLADLAHFYLTHDSPHEVVAFTVDKDYIKEPTHRGLPVIAFEEVAKRLSPADFKMFIPMSFKRMSHVRADRYRLAKEMGYELISYVSSRATTWPGFKPGDNCFIFEDNTIQPFVEIGNDCVLWSGNHIGHHTVIKDHVFITSQVVISGACIIEDHCFFGVNATVRDETVIAHDTLVGAATIILKDTKPYEVYKAKTTEPAGFRSDEIRSLSHKTTG